MIVTPGERLHSDGFLALTGVLSPAEVDRLSAAIDRVYDEEVAGGHIRRGEPMHVLGDIARDDLFLDLVDHPLVLPLISDELGWNIHLYHCHLDVTPPLTEPRRRPAWGWHQDGGRQNLDLDSDPRPRMSLKVAFWLSDVSEPGRGNILVVPGSHERNTLPRPANPEDGFDPPGGTRPVLASPGDALVFDRRLWHSRSDNLSEHTRRVVFLAYSFRWVRPRDEFGIDPGSERFRALSPVRRQLLGEPAPGRHQWGLHPGTVPLYAGTVPARACVTSTEPWRRSAASTSSRPTSRSS
jgi:ectoine hydroxylase